MTDYQKDFISNLKTLRQSRNLSQAELAERCEVTTGTIGNIECGLAKPSFDLIMKIANTLDIHPARLFASEDYISKLNIAAQKSKDRLVLEDICSQLNQYLNPSF